MQRYVVRRLFHRRIRQAEPLPQEVNPQHHRNRKWREAGLALRLVQLDQRNKFQPRHYVRHFIQNFALARAFGRQVQAQIPLRHHRTSTRFVYLKPTQQIFNAGTFANLPFDRQSNLSWLARSLTSLRA